MNDVFASRVIDELKTMNETLATFMAAILAKVEPPAPNADSGKAVKK